jgi:CDP-2,3-bis-(O-geranylgeranyl)-sn-glycerol synthase
MELAVLIGEALKFIFPAYCANGAPVIGGGGRPMDFGKNFFDGKRLFGAHKTFRGFFFGLAIGFLVGLIETLIFGFSLWLAVLAPLVLC